MTDTARVLVVDDEPSFREGLRIALEAEGFAVSLAADGEEALEQFRLVEPDIVLLDVMLPRMSGIDVCRQIRTFSDTPVIMVSARHEEIDTVVGLEVGADDYVSKPYRVRELVARMRSVMRRPRDSHNADSSSDPAQGDNVQAGDIQDGGVQVGEVTVDRDRHEVSVSGSAVEMPLKEFEVLALLMENAGRVVTREILIERVWGFDYVGDTKTLDVHIKRLRSKIETNPKSPERILTVRGLGYKFAAPA